jgi:hypothetical protein
MADQDDLVNRALTILQKVGAGQSASAEDQDLVEGMVTGLLDELQDRGVVYIADVEDFEDRFLHYVAILLANYAASDFGVGIDVNAVDYAEKRLRIMQQVEATDEPVRNTYF